MLEGTLYWENENLDSHLCSLSFYWASERRVTLSSTVGHGHKNDSTVLGVLMTPFQAPPTSTLLYALVWPDCIAWSYCKLPFSWIHPVKSTCKVRRVGCFSQSPLCLHFLSVAVSLHTEISSPVYLLHGSRCTICSPGPSAVCLLSCLAWECPAIPCSFADSAPSL